MDQQSTVVSGYHNITAIAAGHNGEIYFLNALGSDTEILRVDPTDGSVFLLGSVKRSEGLAVVPIPEPSPALLLGLGLMGLGWSRTR